VGGLFFDDLGNGDRAYELPCEWKDAATDIWFFYHTIADTNGAATWRCEVYHSQQNYWECMRRGSCSTALE
jgi:hypothetical protein